MPETASPPVDLHARVEGAGPPVLLLHGLGGDHTVFDAVIPKLAEEFRVLAPDLRGHGRSPAPESSTFSFSEHEGDVKKLLLKEGLASAHVVGLSAGGFLALRLAFDEPSVVRSLVLIGASSHCDAHTRAVVQNWADTFQKDGFDAYVLRLLKDLFYPDWIEAHMDTADQFKDELKARDLRGAIRWGEAIRSYDLRGRLGRLKLPTLIIQGMDDQVVDPSHARLLRVSIPGAGLKLFAQTGHLVPIERPGETAAAILAHVRKVENPSPPA